MRILGIDTSCDETSIALLEAGDFIFKVKSNVISSQVRIHSRYGGVWPFLAKREHKKNLPFVFKKSIKDTKEIDLISVTIGPGLEPCLWEGINFAKEIGKRLNIPIVPVNHIEAHILVNFLPFKTHPNKMKLFPAICLVVSGGHTQLIWMEGIGKYKLLGETRDDAAGECLDKVGRLLGLPYPAGPIIEKLAEAKTLKSRFGISLPRPMIYHKNYDFSFSGLKTAVLYEIEKRSTKVRNSINYKREIAREVQEAVIEVLTFKTLRAMRELKAKTIILGGGVCANRALRRKIKKECKNQIIDCNLLVPQQKYCTDNGVMVALTGFFHREKATKDCDKIKAEPLLKI